MPQYVLPVRKGGHGTVLGLSFCHVLLSYGPKTAACGSPTGSKCRSSQLHDLLDLAEEGARGIMVPSPEHPATPQHMSDSILTARDLRERLGRKDR